MLPLDPHIEVVNLKFPQYIPIEETEVQVLKLSAILFKEKFYNNYCYLELKNDGQVELSLFKSDNKNFDKIEDDFLENKVTFKIENVKETEIIIYSLSVN
jgi:hypothetical protein